MINNAGIIINVDVNAKNWLAKEYVIKDLIGILAVMNVNVINSCRCVYLFLLLLKKWY